MVGELLPMKGSGSLGGWLQRPRMEGDFYASALWRSIYASQELRHYKRGSSAQEGCVRTPIVRGKHYSCPYRRSSYRSFRSRDRCRLRDPRHCGSNVSGRNRLGTLVHLEAPSWEWRGVRLARVLAKGLDPPFNSCLLPVRRLSEDSPAIPTTADSYPRSRGPVLSRA